MKKIAVFPGSFSPFTLGHKSVVDKAIPLFDKIIVAIGINSNKNEFFSIEERKKWISEIYKNNSNIKVCFFKGLTIDLCKKFNATHIIRGLRNSHDFEYEKNIALSNKKLNSKIETLFFITPAEISHVSSTIVREIIKNGGDASQFLPKEVDI